MLTLYGIYFSQKPRICSVCRSCNPALLYVMTYHQFLPRVAWQVPLLEQEQAYLYGLSAFTPVIIQVLVIKSLVLLDDTMMMFALF
jgi:hypothetical protein